MLQIQIIIEDAAETDWLDRKNDDPFSCVVAKNGGLIDTHTEHRKFVFIGGVAARPLFFSFIPPFDSLRRGADPNIKIPIMRVWRALAYPKTTHRIHDEKKERIHE